MERNSSHAVNSIRCARPFSSKDEIDFQAFCKHFKRWRAGRVCVYVCTCRCRSFSPFLFFFDIPRFQHRQNDKALPWILIFARRIVKSLVVRLFKLSLRERRRRIVFFLLQLYNIPEEREDKKYCFKRFLSALLFEVHFFLFFTTLLLQNQPNNGAFCEFQGLCHKLSFIHNFFFSSFFFRSGGKRRDSRLMMCLAFCYQKINTKYDIAIYIFLRGKCE